MTKIIVTSVMGVMVSFRIESKGKATFSGTSLPAPWGGNTSSTGTVVTNYDAEFNTVTDQAGKVRRSMIDALGRLLRVDEPNDINNPTNLGSTGTPAQATSYTYDALGNLKRVDQGLQTRLFEYSSLSRLTSASNPESGTIEYQYDANGNLEKKIDPRPTSGSNSLLDCTVAYTGSKIATCYKYDSLNRPTKRTYNDGTPNVNYTYDTLTYGRGRLTSVNSSVSATTVTQYDALGRVRANKQETQGATDAYTFEYNYNLAGGLVSQKYPSGKVFITEYDSVGRLSGVKKQGGGYYAGADPASVDYEANRIKYTAHGAISQIKLGNGLWEHTGFNSRLQPVEIKLNDPATNSNKLVLGYTYGTTNNNGNVLSQTISAPGLNLTQSYTYDQLNRLKSFQETGGANQTWNQVYSYDRYGNRTIDNGQTTDDALFRAESPAIDQNNNRISATGYVYDLAGNLTGRPNAKAYIYDAENKQTSYQENGVEKGSYSYDGDGRRVKKIASGATTIFVYNVMGQLIAEYGGEPVNNGTRYLTADHLGSTRVVTDSTGNVKERHDYLPFGEEIYSPNLDYSGRGSVVDQGYKVGDVRQKFTQKERDAETGLDYFGARYYASTQGRFISCDPVSRTLRHVANPQRWNLYVYVINSPVSLYDPDGRNDKGKGGGRVIDIFITHIPSERGLRPDGKPYRGEDWRGLVKEAKERGVTVNVYYKPETGAGDSDPTTERATNSISTPGRFVIFAGHSVADKSDESGRPIGVGILTSNGNIGKNGALSAEVGQDGTMNPLPEIRAQAVIVSTCNIVEAAPVLAERLAPGSSLIYNDGGPDGVTPIYTIERSAFAAAQVLVNGGTVQQAADAMQSIINRDAAIGTGDLSQSVGDEVQRLPR